MSEEFYPSSSSSSSLSALPLREFIYPRNITANESQFESFFVGECLKSEKSRLNSFLLWPHTLPLPAPRTNLAAAGFYYTGRNKTIACYSCGIEMSSWRHGIDLNEYHRRSSPYCQHVEAVNQIRSEATSTDFKEREKRLQTFTSSCPSQVQRRMKRFVNAGFYYTGRNDVVKCAFCKGELHALKIEEPMDSHVLFFPKCSFAASRCSSSKHKSKQRRNIDLSSTTTERIVSLKEENQRLISSVTCAICSSAPVQMLTLPCCHLVCCEECGEAVDACPKCSTQILATVKIFLA